MQRSEEISHPRIGVAVLATWLVLPISCWPTQAAEHLTAKFLLGNEALSAPVPMSEFTPAETGEVPNNRFSGLLTLSDPINNGGFQVLHDAFDRHTKDGVPIQQLPEFSFRFVQRGTDVLPMARGVQQRSHPYWEIILQPGKAWDDAADGKYTRVALPFALRERAANCVHNGMLTWLFDNQGRVSRVAYQVSSETCPYFKANLWGAVNASYQPEEQDAEAQPHWRRYDAQLAARLPVRPLAELAAAFPGVDAGGLGVSDGIKADDISVLGLVVDGVHYRSDCPTRHGPYPFCDALPVPSYSTAKSMFAALALMRLEHSYPGTASRTIGELLGACGAERWNDVTLHQVLDMATGNFESADALTDEDSAASLAFIFDDRHASKLRFACRQYPRSADPGSHFVYHSSDTYLLGTALQALVATEVPGADLYGLTLAQSVWARLQLSPLLDDTLRTYDRARQPFTGWGLTFEVDDLLRIAMWLTQDGGQLDGKPILDRAMLNGALQRDPADPGLSAGPGLRYNNGFWAYNAGPSLNCSESVWVPVMSGVSGITVALFPNGVLYYYFSDGYVFAWQSARVAAHTIRKLCR